MGLISKEQANYILGVIKNVQLCDSSNRFDAELKSHLQYLIEGCVYALPMVDAEFPEVGEKSALDKLNYSYLHERLDKAEQNINTLGDNYTKLRDGSDNDFSIVHQRIDKILKHQDQLDHWLHALEKAIMDIKGIALGRMAVPNFVSPSFTRKEKE